MNITGNISLQEIFLFDQAYFPNPWTRDAWESLDLSRHLLLDWGQPELRGFALFGRMSGDDTAHLYKIVINPKWHGTGEAGKFWMHIIENLTSQSVKYIYLEVEASNERALGFYKKVGFICLRRVKAYYSNGSDGLMLQLTLQV